MLCYDIYEGSYLTNTLFHGHIALSLCSFFNYEIDHKAFQWLDLAMLTTFLNVFLWYCEMNEGLSRIAMFIEAYVRLRQSFKIMLYYGYVIKWILSHFEIFIRFCKG